MSSPGDWYQSLPPVCKAWGTACVLCTVGVQLKLINPYDIYLDYPMVFKKFQIWRLVTNFCFLGPFSFPFVIRVMMMCVAVEGAMVPPATPRRHRRSRRRTVRRRSDVVFAAKHISYAHPSVVIFLSLVRERGVISCLPPLTPSALPLLLPSLLLSASSARYGVFLEKQTFDGRTADFVWMVMLGMFTLLPLPLVVPSISLPFCSASLVFMLVYLWSRENPNANTSIMGMIQLKAFYLPWGMMGMTALMGGSVLPDFLGIVAGHLYYFLTVLQPRAGGPTLIFTPQWVQALCFHLFGARATVSATPQAPRVFGGRGRRLGND